VTAMYGEQGVGALLILSQVILSMQLSFAVVPLVWFTSQRAKMGVFTNRPLTMALGWTVAVLIAGLNIWLLAQTWKEWVA